MLPTALSTAFLLAAAPIRLTAHPAPPLCAAVTASRPASYFTPEAPTAELNDEERELIDRINASRTERGLNALTPTSLLAQIAWAHSRDMAVRGYFSHVAPNADRRTPMDRYLSGLHAAGQGAPRYLLVGENIYYCNISRGSQDVSLAHQALMNSPGHRANILDPRFERVGVGIYRDGAGQIWVTELFLRGE